MFDTLKKWDRELFIFLNNLGSDSFDRFWVIVTQIETWTFLFVTFFLLIFKYYKRRKAFYIALFTLLTFGISYFLKYSIKIYVQRLRPNNTPDLAEFIRVLDTPMDFSFYSGHASVSFAITTFLVLSLRKFSHWMYLLFIWPILFSFSRIYVGVHFPSDIIVGFFVGVIIAFGMHYLQKTLIK